MTPASVRRLRAILDASADHIRRVGNTVEIKRSYFYRHGGSAEKFAEAIAAAIKGTPWRVVGSRDDWRAWPKTSYFVAIVVDAETYQQEMEYAGRHGLS